MNTRCNECGLVQHVSFCRGFRLADYRCRSCGGVCRLCDYRGNIVHRTAKAKGRTYAACPVCGRKRLEGRVCWYHSAEQKANAKATGGAAPCPNCNKPDADCYCLDMEAK